MGVDGGRSEFCLFATPTGVHSYSPQRAVRYVQSTVDHSGWRQCFQRPSIFLRPSF